MQMMLERALVISKIVQIASLRNLLQIRRSWNMQKFSRKPQKNTGKGLLYIQDGHWALIFMTVTIWPVTSSNLCLGMLQSIMQ